MVDYHIRTAHTMLTVMRSKMSAVRQALRRVRERQVDIEGDTQDKFAAKCGLTVSELDDLIGPLDGE